MEDGLQISAGYGSSVEDACNSTFADSNTLGKSLIIFVMSRARRLVLQHSVVAALSILLVTLITLWLYQFWSHRRWKNLPPGPTPWPVLGNLPDRMASKELSHRYFRGLAEKFGGLMYLRLGSHPCIVVSTAAVAKELFQKNDVVFASRPTRLYWTINSGNTEVYKNFAGATYGPYWKHLRRLCNSELFSPQRHASYEKVRAEEVHLMMKDLLHISTKESIAINLKDKLYGVSLNNMTRMLTNKRYFGDGVKDEHEREDLQLLIARVLESFSMFVISDYIPSLSFIPKWQGIHKKFEEVQKLKRATLRKMFELELHRERAKERQQCDDKEHVPDFVDVLVAAPLQDGETLADNDIISILSDIFWAGTETTSSTVEWAMAELIRHPDVMTKAQGELDKVIGTHRLVQESDIPHLPYLQAIIKEVLRMHPAVPLSIPHQSTKASTVLGFSLPANTHMLLNIFAIQRDPSVYENPECFNPERFVHRPEVSFTAAFSSYELLPFSKGRRMCPGYNLGSVLVSFLVAHLLHSFDWSMPEAQTAQSLDMTEGFGVAMCLEKPLCLIARPRSPAVLYTYTDQHQKEDL